MIAPLPWNDGTRDAVPDAWSNEQVQRPAQPVRCNALLGAPVLFELAIFDVRWNAPSLGFERAKDWGSTESFENAD